MNAAGDKYIDLVKASDAFRQLKRDAESNLSHAYLLLSADRLGLDILADLFVAEACGARDAYRRIAAGTLARRHYAAEAGEKVTVRDVDYLTETAFVTPTELERKFYIVDYGETMNEPSQNKLLKTLEEPPSVAVIVIKSASESAMLPTVRSRCRRVELKPFASAALGARLGQLYGGSPRAARSACGQPRYAVGGGAADQRRQVRGDVRAGRRYAQKHAPQPRRGALCGADTQI